MDFAKQLEELAINLFKIDAVKFGEFTTKSGMKTPVYFDLRVIVSYPAIMESISNLLYSSSLISLEYDHLCGVPYTALPIATLLSVKANKSMLMRRKEAKSYGTKKLIEGHFSKNQKCCIVEDVVTSGSSVLETVNDLRKEGLVVEEAVIILDREQGGKQNLEKNKVKIMSLLTMSELIKILVDNNCITKEIGVEVTNYLNSTKAPSVKLSEETAATRLNMPYEKRADATKNPIAKQLFNIMATKKTNLCISVDLTSSIQILNLLEKVGEHVCLVKTHVDIIEDFNSDFVEKLKQLATKFNFLLLEDRKFADIGNTVSLQYSKGVYKISEWADCVTVHSLPGEGILKALNSASTDKSKGVFLLAEMSSEGNLITTDYTKSTVNMAEKYPQLMTGFVCQNAVTFDNPGLIQLTPGVQLEKPKDNLGQVYNTPEKVIENGADVVVVGRGIVASKNPETEAVLYKKILWKSYSKRILGKME
ncbi:PREDICTED: uridine 5'-monophosphate synthase isoform X1 [Papilio polytes]|uniref:uridine 5'-monophosphate synthase isoform X1 n=2 Tax=Papilio polytes TaxID=76194 RepID=UPI000676AAE3|nr:PREDICTED: uridine 5'-monophosphate synthase isoform X1 [Papilio polytes]